MVANGESKTFQQEAKDFGKLPESIRKIQEYKVFSIYVFYVILVLNFSLDILGLFSLYVHTYSFSNFLTSTFILYF